MNASLKLARPTPKSIGVGMLYILGGGGGLLRNILTT